MTKLGIENDINNIININFKKEGFNEVKSYNDPMTTHNRSPHNKYN